MGEGGGRVVEPMNLQTEDGAGLVSELRGSHDRTLRDADEFLTHVVWISSERMATESLSPGQEPRVVSRGL